MNDRVQLKREETVGDDVVLSDINPKTNTQSIDDSVSGDSLDKTLDRMWQSINNKLSRIVNSVNGRTGVVVLSPEDVGLDQVDNVSLSDIKKWVINRLTQEFNNKRIALFDTLNDVRTYISDNDEAHKDKPFYSHHGFDGDDRAYIGYIWWDEGKRTLDETHMVIDTVGRTDNSIIYNEDINGRNLSGGGIGVNIWKYEDALELYNDASGGKADSGLRINKDKLVGNLYHFDGVYGNGESDDTEALLWYTKGIPTDAEAVIIYLDGSPVKEKMWSSSQQTATFYLRLETWNTPRFKIGDLIICDFRDYVVDKTVPSGMNPDLMNRNPMIGMVVDIPSEATGSTSYRIDFYTIGVYAGWGLIERDVKRRAPEYTEYSNSHDYKSLDILLATGSIVQEPNGQYNMSGMTLIKKNNDPGDDIGPATGNVMLPSGPTNVMHPDGRYEGGLRVNTDASLCTIPYNLCGRMWLDGVSDSCIAVNWRANVEHGIGDPSNNPYTTGSEYNGNSASAIGINLLKATTPGENINPDAYGGLGVYNYRFTNLSGLRISNGEQKMTKEFLGLGENDIFGDTDETTGPTVDASTSGGLSVNVGKYLEIKPGDIPEHYTNYYDGGKVNVRINTEKGLIGNDNNQIELNVTDGMFSFDESNNNKLKLTLVTDHGIDYSDGGEIPGQPESIVIPKGIYVKVHEGFGLSFDKGSIIIKADTTKGLDFNHLGRLIVKLGEGVEFDENGCISATGAGNALTFTDINGNSIEYKPSADPKTITLGRGLQITDE